MKYLGVLFDRHLNWSAHCEKIKKSVNFGIASINRVNDGLDIKQRVALYTAIIQPHLDYCEPVWSSDSAKVQDELGVLQRKAIRSLFNHSKNIRSEEFMAQHRILDVKKRWKSQEAVWLYKAINKDRCAIPIAWSNSLVFEVAV